MTLSIVFSKPAKNVAEALGRPYIRIRVWRRAGAALGSGTGGAAYDAELFTDRKKKYIIEEDVPVPFLVRLGVMTRAGKVVAQKYDKFRQINRFLEYVADILDELTERATDGKGFSPDRPLRVIDFGCGKSYLTFAVYHFLTGIRRIDADITGLDLKADVIADCQKLAEETGCGGLRFKVGDIAAYPDAEKPDLVITLHACDMATDYALDWAVRQGAAAILSVPCCQHEMNSLL